MGFYAVAGRSAATAATLNHVGAQFWNPHSTRRIWLWKISYCNSASAAGDSIRFARTSVRGTAGSTVTPDVDNDFEQANAPASGALLDLAAFSVQPTLVAPQVVASVSFNTASVGWSLVFDAPGFCIDPGSGFAIHTTGAIVLRAGDWAFTWWED